MAVPWASARHAWLGSGGQSDHEGCPTDAVRERLEELRGVLAYTLRVNDTVRFDELKLPEDYPPFQLPDEIRHPVPLPERRSVGAPGTVGRLIPGAQARYERAVERARQEYDQAVAERESREQLRLEGVRQFRDEYDRQREAALKPVRKWNQEVEDLRAAYQAADPEAVVEYCAMVLERSEYPEGFPCTFHLSYEPASRDLSVEYQLPSVSIVPSASEFRFVKSRDEIDEKARKVSEIRDIYADVVAAVTLRTVHELLEADQGHHLKTVSFTGYVEAVDPATGRDARQVLSMLSVERESFLALKLARIDKLSCIESLGGRVSATKPLKTLAPNPTPA